MRPPLGLCICVYVPICTCVHVRVYAFVSMWVRIIEIGRALEESV